MVSSSRRLRDNCVLQATERPDCLRKREADDAKGIHETRPISGPRPLLATHKVEGCTAIRLPSTISGFQQDLRNGRFALYYLGGMNISWLMRPAEHRCVCTQDERTGRQLRRCDCEILTSSGGDVDDEPECLAYRYEPEHAVDFVLVRYITLCELWVLHVARCDRVVQLFLVDGEWNPVPRLQDKASHISEESMPHAPLRKPSCMEIPDGSTCGFPLSHGNLDYELGPYKA